MQELEPAIREFEKAFGCRIFIQQTGAIFTDASGDRLIDPSRNSHRQCVPELCGRFFRRGYCVDHHFRELTEFMRSHPEQKAFVCHCRNGLAEVAVPLFRAGEYAGTVYAGLWQRPLPREKIRALLHVLPVWAAGLLKSAEDLHRKHYRSQESRREEILTFIETRYGGKLSTEDLARHLYLSTVHTCHLVRQLCGASFSELLLRTRIDAARNLLSTSPLNITEVARAAGFSSQEQFSRLFRRETGLPPGEYRKSHRKKHF